nr:N-acetylmuramic acid 6-phosphate etherase [Pseudaminobacter sp.]
QLGRVYLGLMVHMRASNAKLRQRAEGMVRQIVGCDAEHAARHVRQAEGDVKTAVMLGFGLDQTEAATMLERHKGNLRHAVDEFTADNNSLA